MAPFEFFTNQIAIIGKVFGSILLLLIMRDYLPPLANTHPLLLTQQNQLYSMSGNEGIDDEELNGIKMD